MVTQEFSCVWNIAYNWNKPACWLHLDMHNSKANSKYKSIIVISNKCTSCWCKNFIFDKVCQVVDFQWEGHISAVWIYALTIHNCCCKNGSSKRSNISPSVDRCHLNGVVCGGCQSNCSVYSLSRGSPQHFRSESGTARCWPIANYIPCYLTVLMNAVHRIPRNRDGSGIKCECSDSLGCTAGDWEKGIVYYMTVHQHTEYDGRTHL